jgi:hypothetical protein
MTSHFSDQADPAAPDRGATSSERLLAIGLWIVVGGALAFGIVATLIKASGLLTGA